VNITESKSERQNRTITLHDVWSITDSTFEWRVVVPPNATATAYVPTDGESEVMLNGQAANGLVHRLEAGEHRFVAS
jgi:hypothetical protein